MLLRVVIGFHFFKEGTGKLQSGTFTAKYFLKDAKGPLAPYFRKLIRDDDGRERLCIEETETADGEKKFGFNTDLTLALWDDFIDRAALHYGFGLEELQTEIRHRREQLAEQIQAAREEQDTSVDTRRLEEQRRMGEESILKLRTQLADADRIFAVHKEELLTWLEGNQTEINAHFGTENRLGGFERDGENRQKVAIYVDSLRSQVDTIRNDREKQLASWTNHIEGIWDSLEAQINGLATDKQAELEPVRLHRPYNQVNSNLRWIDKIIPWFDTVVGVLLILGLFTRLASFAGAGFLASVIATQPPWIPGTSPTYYQAIELIALLVIFATFAGRMGGLDYFLSSKKRNPPSLPENQNA